MGSEATRNDILDAAERLMAKRGFNATSIAEICSMSGLPVGSIYWHFKSKDGLLAAVMERGNEQFFAGFPDPTTLPGTPRERFDVWFAANTEKLAGRPHFLRLHLSMCLLEDTDVTVTEIIRRVRKTAKYEISRALGPWVAEFHTENPEQLTAQLASYMLATVDGSFIAQHTDAIPIEAMLEHLRVFLCAAVEGTRPSVSWRRDTSLRTSEGSSSHEAVAQVGEFVS